MNKKKDWKYYLNRFWRFLWKDDSIWSWILNLAIAFLVIKFMVYPLLGVVLGTSYPVVAVVSESMEHKLSNGIICGRNPESFERSFDSYWQACGKWYEEKGISKEEFREFPFRNGFNKGDIIILWRANRNNLKIGDVLIFSADKPQPIIHRIVKIYEEDGILRYQTKGDHNEESSIGVDELSINEERVIGKGIFKIPYLGWLKILFVDILSIFNIHISR